MRRERARQCVEVIDRADLMPLDQIAAELGVSKARVQVILAGALAKIRRTLRRRGVTGLDDLLDV